MAQFCKKIRFLKNVGFTGKGYETRPVNITSEEIYYIDELDRYCYLPLDREGIDFEFIEEDKKFFENEWK